MDGWIDSPCSIHRRISSHLQVADFGTIDQHLPRSLPPHACSWQPLLQSLVPRVGLFEMPQKVKSRKRSLLLVAKSCPIVRADHVFFIRPSTDALVAPTAWLCEHGAHGPARHRLHFLGKNTRKWDCWITGSFYFQFFEDPSHCFPRGGTILHSHRQSTG